MVTKTSGEVLPDGFIAVAKKFPNFVYGISLSAEIDDLTKPGYVRLSGRGKEPHFVPYEYLRALVPAIASEAIEALDETGDKLRRTFFGSFKKYDLVPGVGVANEYIFHPYDSSEIRNDSIPESS